MKLYFALASNRVDNLCLFKSPSENFLFSYHYYKSPRQQKNIVDWGLTKNEHVFLDSGAFSAFTLKKEINLDEYIEYIKKHDLPIYANLDVIGDAAAGVRNEEYMKAAGLKPLPVFHLGDPIEFLDRILDNGDDYFALGGMVQAPDLESWLSSVWEHIYRRNPKVKVHGFGLTDMNLMVKFPWYSCDSSSWASPVRFGRFSVWSSHKRGFFQKPVGEVFRENGIVYAKGDPITGDKRQFILNAQVAEFIAAEKWLNEKHETYDHSYLNNQQKLF